MALLIRERERRDRFRFPHTQVMLRLVAIAQTGRTALILVASIVFLSCTEQRSRPRVVLVGIDGATWKVLGPLVEAGQLSHFKRLTREGAYMPEFDTMETTRSPAVWTSVATGRRPKEHGIVWYTQKLPSGEQVPVGSDSRRVKAIWNVASEAGLTVGVLGWWASWPAEQVAGYVVSDRANPAAVGWLWPKLGTKSADQDALPQAQRDFSPPELASVLGKHWFEPEQYPYAELQRRGRLTKKQMELVKKADWESKSLYSWLKISFAVDYPLVTLACDLARSRPTDLQMLYLRGPDPVQHTGWNLVEPERYTYPPQHLDRDRGVVEGIYRYLDFFLGEIIEANRSVPTTLIVASDHGAEPCPPLAPRPGCHTRDAKGVLFVYGAHVKKGHVIERGNPLDLTPTVAWLLGLPIAADLAGTVLYDAFEAEYVVRRPALRVASYGKREEPGPAVASAADPVLMERLRSLGYVENGYY
jgi:arylsulfatase A-like enzyme